MAAANLRMWVNPPHLLLIHLAPLLLHFLLVLLIPALCPCLARTLL
jgi:hypothetical protein